MRVLSQPGSIRTRRALIRSFNALANRLSLAHRPPSKTLAGGGQRQPGARGKAIVAEMISAKTSIDHSCLCPCCLTSSDVITLPPHQRLASISTDHVSLSLSSLYMHLSDASGPIHTTRDCASVRARHAHVHSYCHINHIIAVSHCTPVANVHNNNNNNNRRCERDFILIPTHFYHATTLQLRAFI